MSDVDPMVAFIEARLGEDEQEAHERTCSESPWEGHDPGECDDCDKLRRKVANEEAHEEGPFDPARVLRGVEAKRQILELHRQVGRIRDPRRDKITFDHKIDICEVCGPFEWPHGTLPNGEFGYLDVWRDDEGYPTLYPCRTVRLMGTEWSAHEVYLANRERWKP